MPLAAFARLNFRPGSILSSRWAHDMAHALIYARQMALRAGNLVPTCRPAPPPAPRRSPRARAAGSASAGCR